MTTPPKPPVDDQDRVTLGGKLGDGDRDGHRPTPATGSPPRETPAMFTGLRRPSSDHLDPESSSHGDPGGIIGGGGGGGGGEEEEEEWAGSSCSVCSDRFWSRSSRFSSDDSYQLDSGEDCAELLLACLYCRFHEVMLLLPETCERALSRCFPSYRHMAAASDGDESAADCCGRTLDCRLSDSCQDAGDLVELAMEISEVCYR
ncbi:myoD family inhibitor domain-containing protein 2 [Scophthalmus maximus]|uniref:myoD family inhibitor domain-containing protein 2 n=1 Tax=Scophthalmus maximus TaxID=52904 RepID=UPI001FA88FAF|nr:myoD family inhibitor domain-containing protein 2 [Scophthalmus maximus]XP_035501350.2 myoD family inhibitor domain-containing protein 2 [Scophthalmus maximus]